jgi:hypothetical protein
VKRALLAFWASWLTVVFGTNLADAAKSAALLGVRLGQLPPPAASRRPG